MNCKKSSTFRIIRLLSFIGCLTSIIHASHVPAPYSVLDRYALSDDAIRSTMRAAAEYQLQRYGGDIPKQNWQAGTFFHPLLPLRRSQGIRGI